MAYRVKRKESVAEAVRRIANEQVGKALDPEPNAHEQIHEVRKRCKKVRALLRLVRPTLGDTYAAENAWYRDTAREVAALRDAAAFVECFEALMDRYDDDVDRRQFAAVGRTLRERRDEIARQQDLEVQLDRLRHRLEAGRDRIADWSLEDGGFAAVGPGVGKTYKRARKAMHRAYRDPTAANFHEWRKRVKYHRFHCRLVRNLWEPVLDARRKEAKRLSDLLGDEHDLAMLHQLLRDEAERFAGHSNLEELRELIVTRQSEIRNWARPLGERLFAEKPKRFVARLENLWHTWRRSRSRTASLPEGSGRSYS